MRAAGIAQCIFLTLRNIHFYHPAGDQREQLVAGLRQLFARSDIALQRRAGNVQRTFLVENAEIHAGHRARRVAEAHHQPPALQAIKRRFPGIFTDGIINHLNFLTVGDRFQAFDDILFAIVNDLPGAGLFSAFGFLRAADGTDQLSAQRFGPLTGDEPDAAGRRVEQERLACFDLIGFTQQVINREPFQERRCRLLERDGVR